jgi:hypothetical protein
MSFFASPASSSALRMAHVFCAALLALFLSACGDDNETTDAASGQQGATTAEGSPATASGEADAGEKLNLYVSCYNKLDKRAHDSIKRYASWIKDMEAGPTGREKVVYGLYPINTDDIARCQKDFEQAAGQKPDLGKLDAAGKDYMAASDALGASVADIYPYYDREDYKDDGFARGKASHAGLVRTMNAFIAASKTFSELLDEENDKMQVAQLARIEKEEGRKIRYWRMAVMLEAKQLADILSGEDFPIDGAAARLASFEKVADEANAYVKASHQERPTSWVWMEREIEEFRKVAKERFRRVRDKVPYSRSEQASLNSFSSWTVEGSPDKLIRAYNGLVDRSNRSR